MFHENETNKNKSDSSWWVTQRTCQRKITGKLVSVNVPRSRELNHLVDYVTNTCHKVPSQNLWDQRDLQLLSSYLNIVEVLQGILITVSFGLKQILKQTVVCRQTMVALVTVDCHFHHVWQEQATVLAQWLLLITGDVNEQSEHTWGLTILEATGKVSSHSCWHWGDTLRKSSDMSKKLQKLMENSQNFKLLKLC